MVQELFDSEDSTMRHSWDSALEATGSFPRRAVAINYHKQQMLLSYTQNPRIKVSVSYLKGEFFCRFQHLVASGLGQHNTIPPLFSWPSSLLFCGSNFPLPFPEKGTCYWNPGWPHVKTLKHICKKLFPSELNILKFWVCMSLRETWLILLW